MMSSTPARTRLQFLAAFALSDVVTQGQLCDPNSAAADAAGANRPGGDQLARERLADTEAALYIGHRQERVRHGAGAISASAAINSA